MQALVKRKTVLDNKLNDRAHKSEKWDTLNSGLDQLCPKHELVTRKLYSQKYRLTVKILTLSMPEKKQMITGERATLSLQRKYNTVINLVNIHKSKITPSFATSYIINILQFTLLWAVNWDFKTLINHCHFASLPPGSYNTSIVT